MRKMEPGFFNERLAWPSSEIERRFVEAWRTENEMRRDPAGLLTTLMRGARWPTPDDEKLAETIIQWLGSNVGLSFLEEVLGVYIDRDKTRSAPRPWRLRRRRRCAHPKSERRRVVDYDYDTHTESRRGEQCGRCLRFRWSGEPHFETDYEGAVR